jgi:hypothetical protein
MSEQHVSETFVVRLEAFGESRGPWEAPGGTRDDLQRLEDDLQRVLRRHAERVRSGENADQLGEGDEELSPGHPGHPGPSTGHS